ncbi:MAG: lysostaphin resistance A-like protein [Candidatus Acidiferrales bacterium]
MSFDGDNPLSPDSPQQDAPSAHPEPAPSPESLLSSEPFTHPVSPIPADLRVPWAWGNLLLLVLMYFILTFLLVLGLAAFGVKPANLQHLSAENGPLIILTQVVLSFGILAYLAAEMRFYFRLPFWSAIGWHKLDPSTVARSWAYGRYVVGGFLFSVLIQLVSASVGTKAKLPMEALFQDQRTAFLLMLMAVTIAPVVEETIFRGYIYPVIARSFGVGASIVATGTLFGMLHAPQLWGGWGQIALLIVVGIVFTYVRSKTGTVVTSYLMHVGYNTFPLLVYAFASHGFHKFPIGQ